MRSPLNKRLFRELRGEFGKYLVIFILMTLTIGMVSGFLVADGSMIQAYEERLSGQTRRDRSGCSHEHYHADHRGGQKNSQ